MKNAYFTFAIAIATLSNPISSYAGDPKYVGDVVGRALGKTTLEGHVGLWAGDTVLEMDGGSMVYTTLNSFKTAGKNNRYYGAKANGATNRYAVLKQATDQKGYGATYTLFAQYLVGGAAFGWKYDTKKRAWILVSKQLPGKFRCDTLVNFAYKYGGVGYIRSMTEEQKIDWISSKEYYSRTSGYTNNWAGQSITPNTLYNSLPTTRN
ncbi:MAG: hypothetical protein WCI11_20585 [Candidatus Methylumidiphilus sp.]